MRKLVYKKGIVGEVDDLSKHVSAIDNLIKNEALVVDMLQGTAAMEPHLWIYYSKSDKMMQGFCIMLRRWINFQRSWKKGELLRMIESGTYSGIQEAELKELAKQKQYPIAMTGRLSPSLLQPEKLNGNLSDEQKKQYLTEYVNNRYCLWPDAAPVLVLCISMKGEVIASVEQKSNSLKFNPHE